MKNNKTIFSKIFEVIFTFSLVYFASIILCGVYGACVWLLKNATTAVGVPYGIAKAVILGLAAVLTAFSMVREKGVNDQNE